MFTQTSDWLHLDPPFGPSKYIIPASEPKQWVISNGKISMELRFLWTSEFEKYLFLWLLHFEIVTWCFASFLVIYSYCDILCAVQRDNLNIWIYLNVQFDIFGKWITIGKLKRNNIYIYIYILISIYIYIYVYICVYVYVYI